MSCARDHVLQPKLAMGEGVVPHSTILSYATEVSSHEEQPLSPPDEGNEDSELT